MTNRDSNKDAAISTSSVPSQRKRVISWLRNIGLTIFVLTIIAAIVGASYQAIQTRADFRRFPPKGKFVDIGGYKLNLNCTGEGSPTVVLESGFGVLAIDWDLVQPDIAKFTRVCSYDRAGYGWSDAGPMPRTSLRIARELHTLLRESGEKPPYVLVGHSSGGLDTRIYNGEFPEEVAGMVLVDAAQEDQVRIMSPAMRRVSDEKVRQFDRHMKVQKLLIRFGIARLMNKDRSEEALLDLQSKFWEALKSESDSFDEDDNEARGAGTLGDKPLIVLTAGRERIPPGYPKADFEQYNHAWVYDLQLREARLSSRGERIIVPSGHMIPLEHPEVVVDAVRKVCGARQEVTVNSEHSDK